MDNKQTIIDAYFKIFKLDNRASQTELELAYDVLTKNPDIDNIELQTYRVAFEYLMCNYYKAVEISDNLNEDELEENIIYDKLVDCLPENVNNILKEFEELSEIELTNKIKVFFSTQTVCLPLFFNSIVKNCYKIFGFKLWTKNQMLKVLNETVFNNIKSSLIFVELSCSPHEIFKYDEIISFMECLQKTFSKKNTSVNLCPKFTLEKTKLGCVSMIIIENGLAEHLKNLIDSKVKIIGCNCNMSTQIQE